MRRANVISGVILAVFGLVMLFAVIPWQIEEGPPDVMSPRLVPNMMMALITGLSILLVVNNLRAAPGDDADTTPPISRAEAIALLKISGLFAVAIALFLWVSPLAAGIALVLGALLLLGERRLLYLAAMPAGMLLAVWFLFYQVLGTAIL